MMYCESASGEMEDAADSRELIEEGIRDQVGSRKIRCGLEYLRRGREDMSWAEDEASGIGMSVYAEVIGSGVDWEQHKQL